jgi:diacylglycerol kinase (ATP)
MIGVITNPNARGRTRDLGLVARMRRVVGSDGRVYETHGLAELAEVVRELRDLGVDTIATCGGDGTNLAVLSAVAACFPAERLPRYLMLRGGTMNTAAAELGVPGHPEQILERFVRGRRCGATVATRVRDLLGVGARYGFLFGAGMAGRFFETYYGGPVIGLTWASVLAARIAGSSLVGGSFARWVFEAVEAEIVVDGERLALDRVRLVVAGAVANAGLGFRPTYRAGTVPGRFHLMATGLSPARLALSIPRVVAGLPLRGQPHSDRLAAEVRIRFAQPQTYTLDGDLFRDTEVVLRSGPRVTFLLP